MHEFLDSLGIKISVLLAGLSGGVLRGLSGRTYKRREIWASPICGALAAMYLTSPAMYYFQSINWPMPEEPAASHGTAFLIGVCAMWITDLVLEILVKWFGVSRPQ